MVLFNLIACGIKTQSVGKCVQMVGLLEDAERVRQQAAPFKLRRSKVQDTHSGIHTVAHTQALRLVYEAACGQTNVFSCLASSFNICQCAFSRHMSVLGPRPIMSVLIMMMCAIKAGKCSATVCALKPAVFARPTWRMRIISPFVARSTRRDATRREFNFNKKYMSQSHTHILT